MRVLGPFEGNVLHAAPPDWINEADITQNVPLPSGRSVKLGVLNILSDEQHNLEERVQYLRVVNRLVTQLGVQEGSRFEIEFDPQYHEIAIHSLTLQREDEVLDLLPDQEIQILNREEGLELHALDGRLKAVLLLTDTRIGDIVDFSYSLKRKANRFDHDPCQGGFVLRGLFFTQWLRRRILYSPDRQVFALPLNYRKEPLTTTESNGLTSCEWSERNLMPLQVEDNIPSWIEPFSRVYYGEYSTWKEVIEWALDLYPIPDEIPSSLAEEVRRIQETTSVVEEQISAALRFVQDHIRYVSVCLGEHTARPHDAATIMKRRYGDCKDKTFLFVTMLRALGIDAAPALVHTVRKQQVAEVLPSPWAFNHVITRLNHNGRTYWIDPVLWGQRGSFQRLHCPEYGKALVIAPDSEDLEDVRTAPDTNRRKNIDEFSCGRVSQLTEYSATRIYEGASADAMRMILANNTEEQIARDYMNELLPLYPGIEILRPWKYTDYENDNRIEIKFEYLIKDLWKLMPNQTKFYFANFYSLGFSQYLYRPLNKKRKMPFSIGYPIIFEQDLDVKISRAFVLTHKNIKIACAAFDCRGFRKTQSSLFHLDFRYTSKKDHVEPREVDDYLDNCDKLLPLLTQMLFFE